MSKKYTEDLKKEVAREFIKGDEIAKKYNLAESTVRDWTINIAKNVHMSMRSLIWNRRRKLESCKLRITELEKENRFLTKSSVFFASKKNK